MKKLSEIYRKAGIAFTFPIEIKNANGKETYFEDSDGYWSKWEYDDNGNETYFESSRGFWCKWGYNDNGYLTYFESGESTKSGTPKSAKTWKARLSRWTGLNIN